MTKTFSVTRRIKWRGSRSLRLYRSALTFAINERRDGFVVNLNVKTAQALIEIIDQAIYTEERHGQ